MRLRQQQRSDRSSALLVDNFNVEEIPFEFSPSLGLGIVAVIFGCDRLRRKLKSKSELNLLDSTKFFPARGGCHKKTKKGITESYLTQND